MNNELRYQHYCAELFDFIQTSGLDGKSVLNLIMDDMLFEDLSTFRKWDNKTEFCETILRKVKWTIIKHSNL